MPLASGPALCRPFDYFAYCQMPIWSKPDIRRRNLTPNHSHSSCLYVQLSQQADVWAGWFPLLPFRQLIFLYLTSWPTRSCQLLRMCLVFTCPRTLGRGPHAKFGSGFFLLYCLPVGIQSPSDCFFGRWLYGANRILRSCKHSMYHRPTFVVRCPKRQLTELESSRLPVDARANPVEASPH